MSYKKFKSFFEQGDEQGSGEFSANKLLKDDRDQFHCDYENYNILKQLVRHGKKEFIKKCIEKRFPVNVDREDKSSDGTPLHIAVLTECPEIVQLLLDNGSSIYKNNGNEETPLLLSAIAGIDQVTDLLLSHIGPKEYSNKEGFSHFHVACMRDRVALVHQFLISGTNIHQSVKKDSQFWAGFTPLHFAVEYRSIETVEFLVKNGADITIQNVQGFTPLHLAFRKRNKKMIDILLSAQCFFVQNAFNKEGLSHFHIACAMNNVAVVKYFLQKRFHELNYRIPYKYYNWSSHDAFCFAIYNDSVDVLEHLSKSDDQLVKRLPLTLLSEAHANGSYQVLNLIIGQFEEKMVNFQCRSSLGSYSSKKRKPYIEKQSESSQLQAVSFEICEISHQTTLHVAVLHKDSSLVNTLLGTRHPRIITMADSNGKTPLHVAFETNQTNLVQKLLDQHLYIDENPVDCNGLSHFHIACATANANVKYFIRKGVDINSPVKMDSPIWAGFTPLHFAVWFHQIEVVKLLLKHGANIAAKNGSNLSPFDLAIPDVIRLSYKSSKIKIDYEDDEDQWELVEDMVFANCDKKVEGFDDRGITPLHLAAMNNDIREIERLANEDTINKRTDLDLPPWYAGVTPLYFAAWNGNKEAAQMLLEYGADVAIQSGEKKTAAHVCHKDLSDVRAKLLISPKNVDDEDGVSLFHLACKYKNLKAVQHFLKMGVDINQPIRSKDKNTDEEEYTPLYFAVEADDSEIVKLLLEHGANVDARDRYFCTPMSLCKSTTVLKMLLDHGADPHASDFDCRTALYNALFHSKNVSFISVLMENGWDINEISENSLIDELKMTDNDTLTLIQYIKRILVLGVTVNKILNKNIESWYFHGKSDIVIKPFIKRIPFEVLKMCTFGERCTKELNLMKETKIDHRTTLHDLLFKNSKDMVIYSKNEIFKKIIDSEQDLRQNYPIYGYLVISQFKRGQKRANLLEGAKTSLSFIANRWMSDLVTESILRFLNDYEIQYLIYAASGRNILPR